MICPELSVTLEPRLALDSKSCLGFLRLWLQANLHTQHYLHYC